MSGKASVTLQPSAQRHEIQCVVKVREPSLLGRRARLEIRRHVHVKDSRPVNSTQTLITKRFTLSQQETIVLLPARKLRGYSYRGESINIQLETRLRIDDGIFFDTTITEAQQMLANLKPAVSLDSSRMIDPKDRFSFFENLRAITPAAQLITLALLVVGAIVIGVNTVTGIHDQFSTAAEQWFYSHVDAEGESQSPFFNSLMGSGVLGMGIWLLIRNQLRKYMTFHLKKPLGQIRRGTRAVLGSLVEGQPRVDLVDVKVRVVACNMECGQYKRGSGTNERTVSFRRPVRAVLLCEQYVRRVPAHVSIAAYLDREFSFDPMFDTLYPPQMLTSSHGLDVHWEVQLIHEHFIDQELVGLAKRFEYQDFMEGRYEPG